MGRWPSCECVVWEPLLEDLQKPFDIRFTAVLALAFIAGSWDPEHPRLKHVNCGIGQDQSRSTFIDNVFSIFESVYVGHKKKLSIVQYQKNRYNFEHVFSIILLAPLGVYALGSVTKQPTKLSYYSTP